MKLRFGKAVEKPPLPESTQPEKKVGLRSEQEQQASDAKSSVVLAGWDEAKKLAILSAAQQIKLPDSDARLHPMIITHRNLVQEWHKRNPDYRAPVHQDSYRRREVPLLVDSITKESLPRVCRIMDGLIKALTPLGCELTKDWDFLIEGEQVSIFFKEGRDKIAHVPTKEENMQLLRYEEEKRRYSYASKPSIRKHEYPYNGRIRFSVYGDKEYRD